MMGQRKDRDIDDLDFQDRRKKPSGKKWQGMKIINKFVEEDFLEDFLDDVDDDSVKITKQTKRKY